MMITPTITVAILLTEIVTSYILISILKEIKVLLIALKTEKQISNAHLKEQEISEEDIIENNLQNYQLSPREKEVTYLLIKGFKYQEIADNLGISPRTVDTHRRKIFEKIEVNRIFDLVEKIKKRTIEKE